MKFVDDDDDDDDGQGHCGACKKKWKLSDSDQCSCGETQTMSHIVESCPQTRLHGGLSKLHSADNDAVAWLTSYMHMTTTVKDSSSYKIL